MLTILHLSGATIWGGNEQQLVNLIFDLDKKDVKNIIYCFKGSPIEKYAKEHSISYCSIEEGKPFSLRLAKYISRVVKEQKIDIIHIHTSNCVSMFLAGALIFRIKKPTVFSKKGISDRSSFLSAIKYNFKGINKTICVSNAVRETFKNVIKPENHSRLEVIYDGVRVEKESNQETINLRETYGIDPKKTLIGNIANHSQAKDLGVFLKTASEIINVQKRKDIHFIQIGEKLKYTEEFIGLIDEYNLHDFVTFTGKIDNAKLIISQFDIFMITSKKEGLPLTIYEAFLKKVPVISTKAGGIPEAISHKENGLLAEIGDFKMLTQHILELSNNEELKQLFIERSYKKLVKYFNSEESAQKTLDIYKSISK